MPATLALLLAVLPAGSPPPATVAVLVRGMVPGAAGSVSTPATTRGTTVSLIGVATPGKVPACALMAEVEVQVTVTPPVVAVPVVWVPVCVQVQPGAVMPVTSIPPGSVSDTVIVPLEFCEPMLLTCRVYSPALLMVKLPEAGADIFFDNVRSMPAGGTTTL